MIAVDTVRLLESDGWIGFPGACFRSGGWTKFAQNWRSRFGNKRRLSRKGSAASTSKLGLLSLVM